MFSGFTSIDLNSTLGQFSSTFSLDNLQSDEKKAESTTEAAPVKKETAKETKPVAGESSVEVEQLKALLKLKDEELSNLMEVFEENKNLLQVEKSKVVDLTSSLRDAQDKVLSTGNNFEIIERKLNEQIKSLENKLTAEYEAKDAAEQEHQDKYNELQLELQSLKQSAAAQNSTNAAAESNEAEQIIQLTNECNNLKLALSQAQSKTESIEKQLSKSKASISEYQTKLTESEAKYTDSQSTIVTMKKENQTALQAIQNTLREEQSQSSALNEQLNSQKHAVSSLQKKLTDSQSELSSQTAKISELNNIINSLRAEIESSKLASSEAVSENQQHLTMITQQVDALEHANQEKQSLQSKLSESQAIIASLRDELKSVSSGATSNSDLLEEAHKKYVAKEQQCTELETKVASLTEKIKDVMQRFIESKTRITSIEQACEQKILEISKVNQSKESEIISLRLKLENIERSSSDHKVRTGELAERYGEAQREISRSHETIKELNAKIEQLTNEVAQLNIQIATLTEEKEAAKQELRDSQELSASTDTSHSKQVTSLQAQLQQKEQEHKAYVAELQLEITSMQSRLKVDTESAEVLDGYKKRAQVALKKANAAAATLQEENNQLKATMEDISSKLNELESVVLSQEETEKELQAKLKNVENELQTVKNELNNTKDALIEAQNRPAEKVEIFSDNLNDVIQELQYQLGEAKQTIADLHARNNSLEAAHATAVAQHSKLLEGNSNYSIAVPSPANEQHTIQSVRSVDTTSWARSVARPVDQVLSATSHNTNTTFANDFASDRDTNESPLEGQSQSGSLLFVAELQSQLEAVKKELSLRGIDIEAAHQELQHEREEKKKLKNRIEELLAFMDRTKKLQEGPDSALNMEYLKNCVLKFMASSNLSEKKRLFPVIATILKLTNAEKDAVIATLNDMDTKQEGEINTFGAIGSIAESFWGYSATAILGTQTGGSGSSNIDRK